MLKKILKIICSLLVIITCVILTIFCSIEYVRKNNIRAYNFFSHIVFFFIVGLIMLISNILDLFDKK